MVTLWPFISYEQILTLTLSGLFFQLEEMQRIHAEEQPEGMSQSLTLSHG